VEKEGGKNFKDGFKCTKEKKIKAEKIRQSKAIF